LLSPEAISVLNSLLPGAGAADPAIPGGDNAIDGVAVEKLKQISEEMIARDKNLSSTYLARLAVPLRKHLFEKAQLDYVEPPKTEVEMQRNMSRPDGWFQKLRDAARSTILPYVISYLMVIYGDDPCAVIPDFNGEEANNARFEAGSWRAVIVLFLDANHVALNCQHLRNWHYIIWKAKVKRALKIMESALLEETALPSERAWRRDNCSAGVPNPGQVKTSMYVLLRDEITRKGCLLKEYAPCGPLHDAAAVRAWSYQQLLRMRERQEEQERRMLFSVPALLVHPGGQPQQPQPPPHLARAQALAAAAGWSPDAAAVAAAAGAAAAAAAGAGAPPTTPPHLLSGLVRFLTVLTSCFCCRAEQNADAAAPAAAAAAGPAVAATAAGAPAC